jgi:two-component system, chemotaxis family, protein-glutamate methylesterase/glutaminase
MNDLIAKSTQTKSHESTVKVAAAPTRVKRPDILAVAVAASTGGPGALCTFFKNIPARKDTAYLVVLHGPDWMLKGFTSTLQRETEMIVCLGEEGMSLDPGVIYLAPGDRHMYVDPRSRLIKMSDTKPINYVKPAADPLFQSVGMSFGDQSVGVVLTGLGRDGAQGVVEINKHGGKVLIEEPKTAVASSMPSSAQETGVVDGVEPLERLGAAVASICAGLSYKLKRRQAV